MRDVLRRRAPSLFRRFSTFQLSEDRKLLESVILRYLGDDPGVKRLPFMGCEWYTKPHESLFQSKDYWTLKIAPSKRCYGAPRHVVDAIKNLERHAPANHFDAIVCNGVFMKTAIETREEAEPSFEACRRCLQCRVIHIRLERWCSLRSSASNFCHSG